MYGLSVILPVTVPPMVTVPLSALLPAPMLLGASRKVSKLIEIKK
jgi:hypothetical protein